MGQLPAILRETNDADAPLHVGGVLSFMEPLCKKLSEDETDILDWISSRENTLENLENVCPECLALYRLGWAWLPPSARK